MNMGHGPKFSTILDGPKFFVILGGNLLCTDPLDAINYPEKCSAQTQWLA